MTGLEKERIDAPKVENISAKASIEEALLQTEAELSVIFDNAPTIMVLVDEDRRIRRANRSMLDFTGRSQDEISGVRVGEVISCIHAFDNPEGCGFGIDCENCLVRSAVLETFRSGKTFQRIEAPIEVYRESSNFNLHVLVSTSLARVNGQNMVLVYLEDITDFRKVKEALQESEQRYRDLYEEAPNAYFSVGTDGIIKQANHSASDMLGYSHGELVGKTIFKMYADTPSGKEKAREVFRKFKDGEEVNDQELEMVRADGSTLWISLSVRPMYDKEGAVVSSRSVVVDIAERKRLDQLKDEFIGLVSHELRIPLTVIVGAVNTALSERPRLSEEEMQQLLQDAASEADSLSHLLENLLELSRAQAERLVLYTEPVNIIKVLGNVVDKIRKQSPDHRFTTGFPRNMPLISIDPLRVERIIYNLVENAVKYSPDGGEIKVFARKEKGRIVIGVTDEGIGISARDREKLFGPFQRLEQSGVKGVKGAGLGLLVCRRLVEAHRGQIWVESEPGQGSTFYFTLPLR